MQSVRHYKAAAPFRRLGSTLRRRGATTVELAIVLPIFLGIIFFMFEVWTFQQTQQSIDQAALEAGRQAMIPGATSQSVKDKANLFLNALGVRNAEVTVEPAEFSNQTEQVTVTVKALFADNGLFFQHLARDYLFESGLTLSTEQKRIVKRNLQ